MAKPLTTTEKYKITYSRQGENTEDVEADNFVDEGNQGEWIPSVGTGCNVRRVSRRFFASIQGPWIESSE